MSLSEMPLIGCRISIISKAKIRYEGFLHSVDCDNPDEPVITLSKVWSFGTEDRPCERSVAPRNEEYNQVVFRGRDLEDVRLVQSSVFLNEDSAIVSAAPGSTITNTQRTPNEENAQDTQTSTQSQLMAPRSGGGLSIGSHSSILEGLNHSASRPAGSAFHFSPPSSRDMQGGAVVTIPKDSARLPDPSGPRPLGDRHSEDVSSRTLGSHNRSNDIPIQRTILGSAPHMGSPQVWNNRDPNYGHGTYVPNYYDQFQRHRGSSGNQWSMNYNRGSRGYQGYIRRFPRPGGWPRQHSDQHSGRVDSDVFRDDYDIEKANAELAAELKKMNISITKSSSSIDGDNSKSEDNASSVVDEDSVTYDKNKSFFDTLSSESIDKANGIIPQGMNRRDERMLNSATFGQVPNQYPRRGGYYPRFGFSNQNQRRYMGGGGGAFSGGGGGFRRYPGPNNPRLQYNNVLLSGATNVN